MKMWPGSTGLEGWAAVDKAAELLAVARENGVPVVHIKGLQNGMKPWVHRNREPSDAVARTYSTRERRSSTNWRPSPAKS